MVSVVSVVILAIMQEVTETHDYRRELEDINQGRFRQIVKSEASLDVAATDFMNRLIFKFRKWHVIDFVAPIVLITFFLLIVVASVLNNKDLNLEKKLGISSSIAALWIATCSSIHGSHRSRHYQAQVKSSEYVKTWTTDPMVQYVHTFRKYSEPLLQKYRDNNMNSNSFNELRNSLADYKSAPNKIFNLAQLQTDVLLDLSRDENTDLRNSVVEVLNFVEAMGQDVRLGVADADYLKDYFYEIVINNYQIVRKFIERRQVKNWSRATWCNLVYLAHTWEKEKVPPRIPLICIRPLVITEKDLSMVDELKKTTLKDPAPDSTSKVSNIIIFE